MKEVMVSKKLVIISSRRRDLQLPIGINIIEIVCPSPMSRKDDEIQYVI